jgi:chromatin segregation and condensation protein Rec8/ScpA/Scc1 (kleisin family)
MYYALVAKSVEPPPVHAVHREPIRLADAVHDILQHLNDGQEHLLGDLLASGDRPRKVFTFLACLEMARRGLVDLRQLVHLGAVRIRALVRAEDVDISTITDDALTPTIKL